MRRAHCLLNNRGTPFHHSFGAGAASSGAAAGSAAGSAAGKATGKGKSHVGKTWMEEKISAAQRSANASFDESAKDERWIVYIRDNIGGMAGWQLFLEQFVTCIIMGCIAGGLVSPEGTERAINDATGLGTSFTTECEWEDVYVVGDAAAAGEGRYALCIPKEPLTLWSQGHKYAMWLLPLQVPIVVMTYPWVLRQWSRTGIAKRYDMAMKAALKNKRL